MRKFTDEIRDYILEHIDERGVFTKKYSEIAHDLSITQQQARNGMLDVVKNGFLEVIQPSSKGISSNPIYKLKAHKLEVVEINPIEQDENGVKTIVFEGVEVTLYLTELGYVLAKEDLAFCTLENVITIDKIISSNPELFKDQITLVNGKDYLSRQAVMTYMLKVNLDKVHPIKRDLIAQFQSQVISVMCESTLRAKLHVTEDRRIKIRHNLTCILELEPEAVESMLIDLEYQMSKTVEGFSSKLIQQDTKIHKLEKENKHLETRLSSEKNAKELLISANNELRAKIMERH